jgi:X-Tfes, XVIPCD
MTISAKDYAALDKDSYNTHGVGDQVTVNGNIYEVIDYYNNAVTGYRGIAYQRTDTHDVAIANRGTEPDGEGKWQDLATDAGMVLSGLNAQMPDARAFAQHVKETVKERAATYHYPLPPITTTGHSLGGAITEILAHEMHWQGVTFNGYGAVDLGYHIPEGGTQVTNYVRATDLVSAASHHFGKVVVLATLGDIAQLRAAGYSDNVTASDLRNPLGAMSFAAHSINNFAPDNPSLTPSDLTPANEALARANSKAIHLAREDIQALRSNTFSLPWELRQKQETAAKLAIDSTSAVLHGDFDKAGKITDLAEHRATANTHHAWDTLTNTGLLGIKAIDAAGQHVATPLRRAAGDTYEGLDRMGRALGSEAMERVALNATHDISHAAEQTRHAVSDHVTQSLHAAQDVAHQTAQSVSHTIDIAHGQLSQTLEAMSRTLHMSIRLDDAAHPDHPLFQQARDGVYMLDAEHHRSPDQRSDQLAAALTVAAREKGLDRIDGVYLNADASRVVGYQEGKAFPFDGMVGVPTVKALDTPIEQSSKAWEQAMRQQHLQQSQVQQVVPQQEPAQQASRGFAR